MIFKSETIIKIGFWLKIEADAGFSPQEYSRSDVTTTSGIIEELKPASNKEIESKDFFRIVSNIPRVR